MIMRQPQLAPPLALLQAPESYIFTSTKPALSNINFNYPCPRGSVLSCCKNRYALGTKFRFL